MATAMVVTSLYAPQGAEAATKNKIVEKNSKSAVKRKNIYIGGQVVDFDAVVKGKVVKDSKGTWKSSDSKIASVDKNGKVKARKNGRVTISFKTKATKKTKSVTVKMTIDARTRASKMTLTPSAVVVKEGEKSTVGVNYEISKKIKAAGGKATTYKLFVESSDEKVAKAYVEGNNKIVVEGVAKSATPVSITVYSAQVYKLENAKKVKYKLTEKFDVKVNGKFDAKQVRANKISVVGTNLSTKAAAYVVKNTNGIVLNLKDNVEVNEAGTVATLESVVGQIPAGLYTVTFDKEDPVEFTAVKQILEKIVLNPADKAILVKGDNSRAVAHYKAFDNFGEDVTNDTLGANIVANGETINKKGSFEFKLQSGTFMLGQSVPIVLVDRNTGKNVSATLTISQYSMLSDISFKGMYDKKSKKFVNSIAERATLSDYLLLFEGKDQYGLEMNAVDEVNVVIGGVTGLKVDTKGELLKIDGEEYMAFKPGMFTSEKLNAGEATIQAFSTSTGKQSAPVKFNVVSSKEVKTLTIGNGAKTIVPGVWSELSYSAVDSDGKPVTDYKTLSRVKLNVQQGAKYKWTEKSGKVVLMYFPAADTTIKDDKQEYISYITLTNNFGSAVLTVRRAPYPAKIGGLTKDTATSVTKGNSLSIKAEDIVFKNQYGDDIDMSKLGTEYALKVSFADNGASFATCGAVVGARVLKVATFGSITGIASDATLTDATEVVSASAVTPGSVAVTLSLIKLKDGTTNQVEDVPGSAYTFNIISSDLAEVKNVRIEDLKLQKSGATVVPEVTGEVDGKRVTLNSGVDYQIVGGPVVAPAPTAPATTGKAIVSVIIKGSGAELKKEYEYSNESDKLTRVELKKDSQGKFDHTAKLDADAIKALFDYKNQYDGTLTPAFSGSIYVTFSNVKSGVEVKNNGLTSAEIDPNKFEAGETVRIKVVFSGTPYVFEGEIEAR